MKYKDAKVVMLSTNKANALWSYRRLHSSAQNNPNDIYEAYYYHLYITSDEEIKEGDWCINANNTIVQYKQSFRDKETLMKIIATTDTSLGLPEPSTQFVEQWIDEYDKGNIITNILIEVEFIKTPDGLFYPNDIPYGYYKLKIDSKNQINMHKQKDSWSRDEVVGLLYRICNDLGDLVYDENIPENFISTEDVDNWIEKNL